MVGFSGSERKLGEAALSGVRRGGRAATDAECRRPAV